MSGSGTLSFGIIGCGRVVRELHVPAWRTVKEAKVVSVCDSSKSALKEMERICPGVQTFADLDKFFAASPSLAFVDIATPGATHAALVQSALSHGLNVICEKPLTISASDATRLYHAADNACVMLTVIHNYRHKRNSEAALNALKNGMLGDIATVVVRFRAGSIFAEQIAWLRRERENRTVLFDSGIHLVDLAMLFLGPLESLRFVDADVDDVGIQRVVFGTAHRNGSRGLFDFMIDAAATVTDIEVQGESGALNLQFFPPGLRFMPPRDTPIHGALAEIRRGCDYFKHVVGERLFGKLSERAASHAHLFQLFVHALRSGGSNPTPPAQVMNAIGLLDQVAARAYSAPSRDVPSNHVRADLQPFAHRSV
jgi:predicted dehydrogenase